MVGRGNQGGRQMNRAGVAVAIGLFLVACSPVVEEAPKSSKEARSSEHAVQVSTEQLQRGWPEVGECRYLETSFVGDESFEGVLCRNAREIYSPASVLKRLKADSDLPYTKWEKIAFACEAGGLACERGVPPRPLPRGCVALLQRDVDHFPTAVVGTHGFFDTYWRVCVR
jgi:hypothetical protein